MAGPTVNLSVVPTGGAVVLAMPDYLTPVSGVTNIAIARMASGATSWTTVWDGEPILRFVDVGDGMPAPLDSTTSYAWRVTDSTGTTQTPWVIPSSSLAPMKEQLTQLLVFLLQGAINSNPPPTGISPVQVTNQMPQNGFQALPFIVVNQDLIQQSEVGIGEDVENANPDNVWSLWANAKNVWRVTILSTNVDERDYYRDFLLSVFRVLKASVFSQIGINVTHSFQAASYPDAREWEGKTPGFYGADLMLELDGTFPVAVLTSYATIKAVASNANTTTGT